MKYIVANWKSNKNQAEVEKWFSDFSKPWKTRPILSDTTIVLCPSLIHLSLCKSLIKQYELPFLLGAQNISPFKSGSYTGEVSAEQLKGMVEYAIIGHSERRANFFETDEILLKKVEFAKNAGIIPILCIQGLSTPIFEGVEIVAYEPVAAIGTGNSQNSSESEAVAEGTFNKYSIKTFLYGGSVTEENISSYFQEEMIGGVLVGGASLDGVTFFNLIQKSNLATRS